MYYMGQKAALRQVKGEKDYLDKVFGGSCERIGRLRHCLDPVQCLPRAKLNMLRYIICKTLRIYDR